MLGVDQTERLSMARGRQSFPPVGCWGSDMKTGKEQRLVGTVKDARTGAAHQNSFSETDMKYAPTARASQTCQNSTSVWEKIQCQNRERREAFATLALCLLQTETTKFILQLDQRTLHKHFVTTAAVTCCLCCCFFNSLHF